MAELSKLFDFYVDNQQGLLTSYHGKYIVIVDNAVVGAYPSYEDAYFDSLKKYQLGTFLIQLCTEGSADYTQTFHSRVIYAE